MYIEEGIKNGKRAILVEVTDFNTREKIIKNALFIKNSITNAGVYKQRFNTWEIAVEQAAKKIRNDKNDSLEYIDWRQRYGKTDTRREYNWRIRFERLCKTDRNTKDRLKKIIKSNSKNKNEKAAAINSINSTNLANSRCLS